MRIHVVLGAVATALILGVTPAEGSPGSEATCRALTKTYESGVARDRKAADAAVRSGFARPRVAPRVYQRVKKRLDRAGRGFACVSKGAVQQPKGDQPAAPDEAGSAVELCRIGSRIAEFPLTAAFPVPAGRLNGRLPIRAQVIYVDFPDAPATESTTRPADNFVRFQEGADSYFGAMSGGRYAVEWNVAPNYLRLSRPSTFYQLMRGQGQMGANILMDEVVSLAGQQLDMAGVSLAVVVVNPDMGEGRANLSPAFPRPTWGPMRTPYGPIFNGVLLAGDAQRLGAQSLVHEMGHLFGLMDLYDFGWRPPQAFEEQFAFMGHFDLMNYAQGRGSEMIGWHRWLLGWIDDGEVACRAEPGASTHHLLSLSEGGSGHRIGVVPLDTHRALVLESRRANPHCTVCQSGVLAYVVDGTIESGRGPIRMVRKPGSSDPMYGDAFLTPGDSITVDGVTVTSLQRLTDKDVIRISRP